MTSEAPKLLPCPFCGSDRATIMVAKRGDAHRIYPLIRCNGCYIDVPGGNDDYSHDAKTAIRAWNTRDTTHAQAMVAAAYEDAATASDIWQVDVTFDGTIGSAIRARTTAEERAALDALLKAEREAGRVEGLREAVQIADKCDSLRAKMAIKAAIEKDADHE